MTLAIKGNKSADATTPLRGTARGSWRVIQNGPNWHAIPVQVPLANTENEKMNISTEKTVTLIFFQSKLGDLPGGQAMGKKDKLWVGPGV
jgi:hypothetical protein